MNGNAQGRLLPSAPGAIAHLGGVVSSGIGARPRSFNRLDRSSGRARWPRGIARGGRGWEIAWAGREGWVVRRGRIVQRRPAERSVEWDLSLQEVNEWAEPALAHSGLLNQSKPGLIRRGATTQPEQMLRFRPKSPRICDLLVACDFNVTSGRQSEPTPTDHPCWRNYYSQYLSPHAKEKIPRPIMGHCR
jgi:hypothetical protein